MLFMLLIVNPVISAQENPKNILGVSMGITPGLFDLYIGEPHDIWPSRKTGPVYHIFYAVQIKESLRIGPYYEYEQAKFSDDNSEGIYGFDRYNLGVNWLTQFPLRPLHFQFGGYIGYGFLKAQSWDKLTGFDFGLMAGPAYEWNRLGISLHIESGNGLYSSNGSPGRLIIYTPRILAKIYIKFSGIRLF